MVGLVTLELGEDEVNPRERGLVVPFAPPGALGLSTHGLLVGAFDGFWEIPDDAAPRFVEVRPDDGYPWSFLPADFDGDGREDLVTLMEGRTVTGTIPSGESVSWSEAFLVAWRRGADGALARTSGAVLQDGSPPPAAAGDLDGDGAAELVVHSVRGPVVHRLGADFELLQLGAAELPFEWTGAEVRGLVVHDVDGDGDLDVLGFYDAYSMGRPEVFIAVFAGDGRGTLAPPALQVIGTDAQYVAGPLDVTGDGISDLVAVRTSWTFQILVSPGLGQGRFGELVPVFEGERRGVMAGDLDGDGVAELVKIGAEVEVLRADGTGGFTSRSWAVPVGQIFSAILAGGRLDALLELACHAPCDNACTGACLLGGCFECVESAACPGGSCRYGGCSPPAG